MKRYKVEYRKFRFAGTYTYDYAIIDSYTFLSVKAGFKTGWDAISWAIMNGGISIMDLDISDVY